MLTALAMSALVFTAPAAAEDCNAKTLSKQVLEEPPLGAARLYVDLAKCDAGVARKLAGKALPRFIGGEEGNGALVAAIEVGAIDEAVAWVDSLQSDDRAKAVSALGEACNDSEAVRGFFVNRRDAMGAEFWSQRWYSALDECADPAVQDILWTRLQEPIDRDRTRWFAVLETAARGTGPAAVDKLKELLGKAPDAEVQSNVVAAFADAAQVGGMSGTHAEAAKAGVAAIVALAPGDAAAADALVAVRYKNVLQDGKLMYGVVVHEDALCKGGKQRWQRFWTAPAWDAGVTWPDQAQEKAEARVKAAYATDLADKCKASEGKVDVIVSPEPFADAAAMKTWADGQVKKLTGEDSKKVSRNSGGDAPDLQL
jgi:hypothetical protein